MGGEQSRTTKRKQKEMQINKNKTKQELQHDNVNGRPHMRIAASCPKLLKGAGRWHAEALDSSVARAHDAISLGRGRRSWGAVVAGR